jgi:hypothetical protein
MVIPFCDEWKWVSPVPIKENKIRNAELRT